MMYHNACTIVISIINNNDNAVAMHLKNGRNEQNYQTILGCNTHGINSCCFVVLIIDCIVGRYSLSTCFEQ